MTAHLVGFVGIAMSASVTEKLLQSIDDNRDRAIAFLRQMIAIPSVTGDEAKIQKFLADYMGKIGLDVDLWETDWEELKKHPGYRPVDRGYEGRPNIVATLKGTGGGRSLLLNGHTDVIPVGGGGWSDDPWSATIKNGRIYGRGSADMKSGVASHIMAVECLMAAGLKPKGDVYINVVVDEEVSGHGTLDTVIRGKPAGIQKRYEGISGIELGNKIVKAVADLEAKRVATVTHPLYPNALDTLPCIIGSFSAGNYPSAFPVNCLLKGSIGTVPGEDHEGVKQSLVEQVARAAAEDSWMKHTPPKVRFVGYDAEASEIQRNHPSVETVCRNYKQVTGRDPEISGRQGAADTRFLNRYANTPTVIFGPGSTAVMHANDEYVSIDDYLTAIKVVALSICDWCGVDRR